MTTCVANRATQTRVTVRMAPPVVQQRVVLIPTPSSAQPSITATSWSSLVSLAPTPPSILYGPRVVPDASGIVLFVSVPESAAFYPSGRFNPQECARQPNVHLAGGFRPRNGVSRGNPHSPDFGLKRANVYRGLGGVFWRVRDLIRALRTFRAVAETNRSQAPARWSAGTMRSAG